eukprot:PITA_02198
MWVYFLKYKSDVFSIFQKFKSSVEKESGCSIITLRTDNGREFCSSSFSNFCDTHGIKRQLTTPYTPQQNSVVERRNHMVVEMARSILQHRNAPNKFWAEEVFMLSIFLTDHLLRLLREDSRKAAKCSKLDSKSQKLMMTRYSDHHKAYRLIDIDTGHLSFSRDVVFDEDKGLFQSPPSKQCSENQPHSVLLPVGPLDGRDDAASIFDDTLPELPPKNNPPLVAPIVPKPSPPPPDIGSSTLRPKWWAKTIGDLRDNELLEGRTSRHKSKQQSTVNFALMANLHSIFEPQNYLEAKGTSEWEQAMEAEFQSLQKNHTWTLSNLPAGKNPISCKWVYKVKYKVDGTLDKYKARLVARGFS